jgi:murein DD-endopeptidase MepM/ murein hydrolase activator NlpD
VSRGARLESASAAGHAAAVRSGPVRPDGARETHHGLLRSAILGAVLVGGCGDPVDSGEPERASESGSSGATARGAGSLASDPAGDRRSGTDLFAGIEALRPQPWTGWPLENIDIETEAGWRIDPVSGGFVLEHGLSFAAGPGEFVLAIAPGEVVELRPLDEPSGAIELVLAHGDGIESRYAPLADALVHAGLPVARGSAIGLVAGRSLRLEVRVDGITIDPLLLLRQPLHRWPASIHERARPAADG